MNMLTRREVIRRIGIGAIASGLPALSFAKANTDVRFVLLILRGGVDGLAVAAPYGDGNYRGVRGELAIAEPGEDEGLLKLDGMFALHPSLRRTHELYQRDEALLVHAVASPYRERSHFDGQDILENGSTKAGVARDGWLNRAIGPLGGRLGSESAIAMAQNTPLVLRGDQSVTSWAPSQLPDANEDTLRRIERLYSGDEFFSTRLQQALDSQEIAATMDSMRSKRRNNELEQWKAMATAAAKFLTAPAGPRIAVLEASGWDTHANQGSASGYLANRLSALDESLDLLHRGLGNEWSNTVVAVVTEFGRTVRVNGTRGTDHGTAGTALLLGGAVNGGRIVADWPGLKSGDLYEGRDLYPTTDLRSVFKGILISHLQLPESYIANDVFPESSSAKPLEELIRT